MWWYNNTVRLSPQQVEVYGDTERCWDNTEGAVLTLVSNQHKIEIEMEIAYSPEAATPFLGCSVG